MNNNASAFLNAWHEIEKRLVRTFGAAAIVCSLLPFAIESRGDSLSGLVTALLFSGGLWLINRTTRPRPQRIHLSHLSTRQQIQRGGMAAVGAALAIYAGYASERPLFFIPAVLLVVVAGWYRWRVMQIQQYKALLHKDTAADEATDDTASSSE